MKRVLLLIAATLLAIVLVGAPAYGQDCTRDASGARAQYGDCGSDDVIVVEPSDGGSKGDVNTAQQNTSTIQQNAATYGNSVGARRVSAPDVRTTTSSVDAVPAAPVESAVPATEPPEASPAEPASPAILPDTGGISQGTLLLAGLLTLCICLFATGVCLRRSRPASRSSAGS